MSTDNLHKLPDEMVLLLCEFGQTVFYSSDKLIHARGDVKPGLSVVISGLVKVGNYGLDGKYCLTRVLEPGETFGEFTLFGNLPRTHNAESLGDTEVLQLNASEFDLACQRIPQLKDTLLASLATKLHDCLEILDDVRRLPLTVRLAKTLVTIAKTRGTNDVVIRQSDLADVTGVTVLSCHKALNVLTEQGLIKLAYGRIIINDRSAFTRWIEQKSELTSL
ncbi:Crp/Fnr family transcriptional regulator [Thalassotalea sp. M1531]|uniref:Crp/Fnr family transcriptional regulator n=1 Tax=Thalassotalea algicola TaxID=2716224 RepID=A0A7Y0LET4_9GAMM|nr:Crp/Fnr family transcriptional regulator [Thalassotalea algicola]NMP33225.1 Crp/Fnr family transcriptional regulator [Thalassotalea algicola]